MTLTPQQQQLLAQTQQQMQQRATSLDTDNQELETLLAQSRQQIALLSEQVVATQDQLKATTDRLASTEQQSAELKNRTQALMASTQQGGAPGEFRPNNTLLRPLSVTNMPGVSVQQDGDTIRVRVAGKALFQPNSNRLQPGADMLLRRVAADLMANYPEHIIGIEGHTSALEPGSAQFPTPHHLSIAQATTVYDTLRQTMGAAAQQLFILGHGGNHPIASNAELEGQELNRRIELVVYPETLRRR